MLPYSLPGTEVAETHLLRAMSERSYFRKVVKDCQDAVKQHYTSNDVFSPPPAGSTIPSVSGPACVHYSYDFARQVHYSHNPLQPGPVYFQTAWRCAIFGICCEGIPRQVNYLIDEVSDTGKGANTVASLLHHFRGHHALGEVEMGLPTCRQLLRPKQKQHGPVGKCRSPD